MINGDRIVQLVHSGATHHEFFDYYLEKTPSVYHLYWKNRPFIRLSNQNCAVCIRCHTKHQGELRKTLETFLQAFVCDGYITHPKFSFELITSDGFKTRLGFNQWVLLKRSPKHIERFPLFTSLPSEPLDTEDLTLTILRSIHKQFPETKSSIGNIGFWKTQNQLHLYYQKSLIAKITPGDKLELTILPYAETHTESRIELRCFYDYIVRRYSSYHAPKWKSRRLMLQALQKFGHEKRERILCLPGDTITVKAKSYKKLY